MMRKSIPYANMAKEARAREARAQGHTKKYPPGGGAPVVEDLHRATAVATERHVWIAEDLDEALYVQINTSGDGHTVTYAPNRRMRGRVRMAIGAPPKALINLCRNLRIPVVDLSVAGFSLAKRDELLQYEMGNHPEHGGDLKTYLAICEQSGAAVHRHNDLPLFAGAGEEVSE